MDFTGVLVFNAFMRADFRISVKDYSRSEVRGEKGEVGGKALGPMRRMGFAFGPAIRTMTGL